MIAVAIASQALDRIALETDDPTPGIVGAADLLESVSEMLAAALGGERKCGSTPGSCAAYVGYNHGELSATGQKTRGPYKKKPR